MQIARQILKLAFVLIFLFCIKLVFGRIARIRSKTANILKGPYFLLPQKLKSMITKKLGLRNEAIFYHIPPISERSCMGEISFPHQPMS